MGVHPSGLLMDWPSALPTSLGFLVVSSPCLVFYILHIIYLYNIITIAILCPLYQLLIGMTITYRNNFWLYIFVCRKINFALKIRRNNNFVIFR